MDSKKLCKCCGKYELDKESIFQVCPICGWESDPTQEENPNLVGGANELSLNEYKKNYNSKYMDLIFEYNLCDAWMFPIQELSIYNRETDNVVFVNDDDIDENTEEEEKIITIKKDDLKSIKDILTNNNLIYKIDKIKMPDILDGSYNKFYFSNDKETNCIECYNIWYYLDNDESEDAKVLINVFNEISNILKKYGIKLSLGDE
jgi:hypothetical protein